MLGFYRTKDEAKDLKELLDSKGVETGDIHSISEEAPYHMNSR